MRNLVREQYADAKELLLQKKDLIEALANRLMEKETVNLPDIIEILGQRPFGMNETMTKYLSEMQERQAKEAAEEKEEEKLDE